MIALRVEDGYGGAVELVVMPHEGAAVVNLDRADRMPDLFLDPMDLRDLARAATLAATMLDEAREVTP